MFLQIPVASLTLVFRIYKNNIIVPESMPSGAHKESERIRRQGRDTHTQTRKHEWSAHRCEDAGSSFMPSQDGRPCLLAM